MRVYIDLKKVLLLFFLIQKGQYNQHNSPASGVKYIISYHIISYPLTEQGYPPQRTQQNRPDTPDLPPQAATFLPEAYVPGMRVASSY